VDPEADHLSQCATSSNVQIVCNVTFATHITCLLIGVLVLLSHYASHLHYRKNIS